MGCKGTRKWSPMRFPSRCDVSEPKDMSAAWHEAGKQYLCVRSRSTIKNLVIAETLLLRTDRDDGDVRKGRITARKARDPGREKK